MIAANATEIRGRRRGKPPMIQKDVIKLLRKRIFL
jgi:hypothetical protein